MGVGSELGLFSRRKRSSQTSLHLYRVGFFSQSQAPFHGSRRGSTLQIHSMSASGHIGCCADWSCSAILVNMAGAVAAMAVFVAKLSAGISAIAVSIASAVAVAA